MVFYVYTIQSVVDGTYYKGSTQDPLSRLAADNRGDSNYTKHKTPWILIYVEELPDKKQMLKRELKLKRGNKAYLDRLIASEKNIVHQFG